MTWRHSHHRRALAIVLVGVFASGCATFSADGGFDTVRTLTREKIGKEAEWVRSEADQARARAKVKELLARPLGIEEAVQVALLNNPGLQARYAELGIAEADLVQAGRLANPGFSYARLRRAEAGGVDREYERAFIFDVLGLVTMPTRTKIERRRFAQAQLRAAIETLRVAAETRRAYVAAVAARESVNYLQQVKLAAEASAELARRMRAAGNWNALRQAREQAFYAEVTAQLARAEQAAVSERERLARLLALRGTPGEFELPARLAELPAAPRELTDAEAQAMQTRLDVVMAQRELEALAAALGLTRATGFVNVLELSYLNNSETGQPRQTGYEIELRVPLFDWGGARVAKAETIYMQAVQRAAQDAVNARSEVREAYLAYRTTYDLARHYRDEIVPLRKRISEENLQRYNGMLINVFELLADAREQAAAVNAYIEALRDYHLAESRLQMALAGPAGSAPDGLTRAAMPASGGGESH